MDDELQQAAFELRRAARMAMHGVPERLALAFAQGGIEMRAKPSGHGTTNFEWNGYATAYGFKFPMWDQNGEPFTESVVPGAAKRSLANPHLDVPFLIGHNDAGIPLARTKSGTMTLSDDSHGVHTHVPEMDGRREEVRALASAQERGDIDEMSMAFICMRQAWDKNYEHRSVLEIELHRGDVCAVTHGANPATAGASMRAVEQLAYRRPVAIGGPVLLGRERRTPTQPYTVHAGEDNECPVCHSVNDDASQFCDQCGHSMQPKSAVPNMPGVEDMTQKCSSCGQPNSSDAKFCGQCGHNLVMDPGHSAYRLDGRPRELLSVPQAERDKAHAAGNSLPDKSYPINNVAQLKAAAVLAASHHGDWKAAQALIRRRAKELGVDVSTLPGFGGGESNADGRPLESRASAAESTDLATAPDYDADAAGHTQPCKTCASNGVSSGMLKHPVTGASDKVCPGCHGTGAVVTVDDSTGIPGDEQQLSPSRRLELRMREMEMEELARA